MVDKILEYLDLYVFSCVTKAKKKLKSTFGVCKSRINDSQTPRITYELYRAGPGESACFCRNSPNGKSFQVTGLFRQASGVPRLTYIVFSVRSLTRVWKTLDFGGGVNEGAPKIDFGTTYFLCNR